MALWTINQPQDHDIYTIVYLLKDALKSAISDAWFFERTALPKADVKGAGHAEIAARLGRFREGCKTFQEREALMLMKMMRARNWASELRKIAPDFQDEIEQMLEATSACEALQAEFVRDAQRMFNGGGSLSRFLSLRQPDPRSAHQPIHGGSYLVGGRTALFELRTACEVFLAQIDDVFFSARAEEVSDLLPDPAPVPAGFLEAPKHEGPLALPLALLEDMAPAKVDKSPLH
jgi:hypothetical protein